MGHLGYPGAGDAQLTISSAEDEQTRAWLLRLHLLPGQTVLSTTVDGVLTRAALLQPVANPDGFFPFGGAGTRPAPHAGVVVEVRLPSGRHPRRVEVNICQMGEKC